MGSTPPQTPLLTGFSQANRPVPFSDLYFRASREDLLAYFHDSWALTGELIAAVAGDDPDARALYAPLPPHRGAGRPLLFYLLHPAAVYAAKLTKKGLLSPGLPAPDADLTAVFDLVDRENASTAEWPAFPRVMAYRSTVFAHVSAAFASLAQPPREAPIHDKAPSWALLMSVEHERLQLERTLELLRCVAPLPERSAGATLAWRPALLASALVDEATPLRALSGGVVRVACAVPDHDRPLPAATSDGGDPDLHERVMLRAGGRQGWVERRVRPFNPHPRAYTYFRNRADAFRADGGAGIGFVSLAVAPGTLVTPRFVSNADWAAFLEDAGAEGAAPPDHWEQQGGDAKWTHLRTPLGAMPLDASAAGAWPVEVSLESALAYLRWKERAAGAATRAAGAGGGRFRLPTEAELYCLDADLRAEAAATRAAAAGGAPSPASTALPPRNIDLRWHSPRCVAEDAASGSLGNVWQWAVDAAAAAPASSTPSFALVGGSWASTGDRVTAARYNAAARVGPAYRAGGFRYVVESPAAATPSAAHDPAVAVVSLGVGGEEGERGASGAARALLRAGWRVFLLLQPPRSREQRGGSAPDAVSRLLADGASELIFGGKDGPEALAAALSPAAIPALRAVVLPTQVSTATWRDRLWAALCDTRATAAPNPPSAASAACAFIVIDAADAGLPPLPPAPATASALRPCTLRPRFPLLPAAYLVDAPSESEPPRRTPAPPVLPPGDGVGSLTFGRLVAALAQALTMPQALHAYALSQLGGSAAAEALAASGEGPVLDLADRAAFLCALAYCEAQAQ